MGKRTKIVCTLGPATEDDDVLRDMLRAGMNVARLNCSHGTHDYHRKNIERVRRIAAELGTNVAVLIDTKGPEIRTGETLDHKPIRLEAKSKVVVTTKQIAGTPDRICLDYDLLPQEVQLGSSIFLADGLISLRVDSVEGSEIYCTVVDGGILEERKGVNVPNLKMQLPAVTEQDKRDIAFACEMDVDAIAASFVCDADAVNEIRELCRQNGAPDILIFSKIESALAVNNFDAILEASDGIMVARGDLGVEIPPAKVPHVQKHIISECNAHYLPVITATQMLESMTHSPRPTRAEVTDVANSIIDGTDCVMLSGETAAGEYPVDAVRMMAEICEETEGGLDTKHTYHDREGRKNVSASTSYAAVGIADIVGAVAIVCPTTSGRTARIMSVFRPRLPILATSHLLRTVRRTCFYWGVTGLLTEEQQSVTQTCYDAMTRVQDAGYAKRDDLLVITAGDPLFSPITKGGFETVTNMCMVAEVI